MEILIQNTNTIQSITEKNKTLWRLYIQPSVRSIIVLLSLGVLIIVLGATTKNTFDIYIKGSTKIYNLHISISIGLAFILLGIIYSYHILKSRRSFFRKVDKIIHRHSLDPMDGCLQINDEGVKYSSFEMKQDVKWAGFSHYKLYKGYLFLLINEEFSSFVIDRRQVKDADFIELYDFVQKRLIEKN